MAARVHEIFDRRLAETPDAPLLFLPDETISVAGLGARVDRVEAELRADGVVPGDRVLIIAENCPEHIALILACSRLNAWSCGVNARMAPGEVADFIFKADPRVVYFTTGVSSAARDHAGRYSTRPSILPGLARGDARKTAIAEPEPLASEVAAIIFTSGTTGSSKGVMVTHRGLVHFARVSSRLRGLSAADRVYAYLPMTHIFGLGTVLMAALLVGAGLVMRSRFDPKDVVDALAHDNVSNLLGPPTLFGRVLAHLDQCGIDRPPAPALRYLYTGAGPLDPDLKRAVEARFGLPLHHGYGLSEYAGSLCITAIDAPRSDTATGHLAAGAELRIVAAHGEEAAPGERGEIWLRGTGLMRGYFRDAAATAAVMRPGGWYASGDIGYLGPDGALFVVGRLKEMIIRSGFNVYPAEVEGVLNAFPAIRNSAVVGAPEADGNEAVVAFVETGADAIDTTALDRYLRERLAPYKRPSRIIPIDSLPMTGTGKVLKRQLLERLSASTTGSTR
jgi:malonyl-CoA/methylmalonyl-CoA synthetase